MTFCRSINVKKVMKLLAFIFEQPSYTVSIENKFIITEFLPCVRQFCDQDQVFCMNRFLSHLIREKLCAF